MLILILTARIRSWTDLESQHSTRTLRCLLYPQQGIVAITYIIIETDGTAKRRHRGLQDIYSLRLPICLDQIAHRIARVIPVLKSLVGQHLQHLQHLLGGPNSLASPANFAGFVLISNVPEPSTLAIFVLGIMGLASRRFKKQS
jgi:hypothetical protein